MVKNNNLLILILAIGVFGILSTEMGVIGILPVIADTFGVTVSQAGWLVSLFALVVAFSGPTMPVLFSRFNRKRGMLFVLGIFIIGNLISIFTTNFTVLLFARIVPAFFHPVYISLALTLAATSSKPEDAPKSIAKIMMAVSAGMILGVPIATFIANAASLQWAMSFFAVVNAAAFVATLFLIPSMPAAAAISGGAQVSVLKKPIVWLSIAAVILINSAIASVNSYLAEFLSTISMISGQTLSLVLFVFGIASLGGNLLAGKLLANNARKSVVSYPIILGIAYTAAFILSHFFGPVVIAVVVAWGVIFAIGNNISQYWIASSAPEAPEFANGLFLTCGNLGITLGTAVGGFFLSGMGIRYVIVGGLLFLVLSLAAVLLRNFFYKGERLTA
ncbi:MFS transporter [Paenibacillus arenilitoris]|uniref:MFS transporter n=1 Tax=Paenibacillus arenilitoris TaxID=2772299 RepID=A0A927CUJ9_9BACL|nr:MFS transporter [Paenibacillus arenilitoris]MBD2872481.1 MFS transporter [Paenibacillus arenilitoris]